LPYSKRFISVPISNGRSPQTYDYYHDVLTIGRNNFNKGEIKMPEETASKIGKWFTVNYAASTPSSGTTTKIAYVVAKDFLEAVQKVLASDIGQSNTFKYIVKMEDAAISYQTIY
jgi:hypothetical protein